MTVQTNPSDLFLKCRRWGQIPPHQMQWQMQHTHTDAHAYKHKTSTSVLVCLKFSAKHSWHCMMFSSGCCHGDGAISCTLSPQLAELIFTEQMRRWFCIYLSFFTVKFKDAKVVAGDSFGLHVVVINTTKHLLSIHVHWLLFWHLSEMAAVHNNLHTHRHMWTHFQNHNIKMFWHRLFPSVWLVLVRLLRCGIRRAALEIQRQVVFL